LSLAFLAAGLGAAFFKNHENILFTCFGASLTTLFLGILACF